MLWNTAATGKYPHKHGIHGFTEPDHKNGGARPFSSYSRKSKALWNILSQQGMKSNVINWWASHPAEPINGCVVTNLFQGVKLTKDGFQGAKGVVHPEEKQDQYIKNKVFAHELTSEQLCAFVPLADQINQDEDSRLETLSKTLAECLTTHSVATEVMSHEPWDFMAIYYTAVDHFSHAFMQYHPPKMEGVKEEDYQIFKDVVRNCYRFSDMMLKRLLELCNEDTTVLLCSDHGFQSGVNRPVGTPREPAGPAVWHRQYGIFVMKGPNIKQDELIHGASLIDIAPTVLVTLGLPVGQDMDGRPLLEVFEEPPEVQYIPSWEDVPGDSGMHQNEPDLDAAEAEELLKQFVALGYIDDPGDDKEKQQESADNESKYNLARSLIFASESASAVPILAELVNRHPWETRYIIQWIGACDKAGYHKLANRIIEAAFDLRSTRNLQVKLIWCRNQLALKQNEQKVLDVLGDVVERATRPGHLNQAAQIFRKLRRWYDAESVYQKALALNEDNAEAWSGLAAIYRHGGKNQATIDAALNSVSLIHRQPHTHLNLGIALARAGDLERAIFAIETSLKFLPNMIPAHRWLATIYRMQGDTKKSEEHRQRAKILGDERKLLLQQAKSEFTEPEFNVPEFESEERRAEITDENRPQGVDPRKPSGKTFVLVSGLPRSGTSLMMQLLEAGGLPPKTDGEREADIDNPKGYYEWEAIKRITHDHRLLNEEGLENKAIKVISMLLPKMPYMHNYKVIFMTRPWRRSSLPSRR